MNTRAELIEGLRNVLAIEMKARDSYIEDINTFRNFKFKETIQKIKKQEDDHIAMLNELIRMLERR